MILHVPVIERLLGEVHAGRPVALCVVVGTRGSTPQAPGALMVVDQAMQTSGTLGGGCVEAEVRKRAFALLRGGASELLSFTLDHVDGWDDGLICGGAMDIAVVSLAPAAAAEPYARALADLRAGRDATLVLHVQQNEQWVEYRVRVEREPTLLIAGAGHVGAALAKLCVGLEFRVVVVDDRADFAHAECLPPPIEPIAADIETTLRTYPIDAATYVVIVTRGHRHDQQALAAVVGSAARYVGMIGSRRKVRLICEALLQAGVDPAQVERVHAPIGLPIHAVTVPEIAVSIAAQLIEVRRAQGTQLVVGPTPLGTEAPS